MKFPNINYYWDLTNPYSDDNVQKIQIKLCALGHLKPSEITGYFGLETENAVKLFQGAVGLNADGVVGRKTWDKLFNEEDVSMSDTPSNNTNAVAKNQIGSNNPSSFFNKDHKGVLRQNGNNIKIIYGDNYKTKIIQEVVFRGKTQVVNATGEPIADAYDFIAKDIIEPEEDK